MENTFTYDTKTICMYVHMYTATHKFKRTTIRDVYFLTHKQQN